MTTSRIGVLIAGCAIIQTATASPCYDLTVAQCKGSCTCRRVSCCGGKEPNGVTIKYDGCITLNDDVRNEIVWKAQQCSGPGLSGFGCIPQYNDTCVAVPTPAPLLPPVLPGAPYNAGSKSQLIFGATFPMLGSAPVPQNSTWHKNIYKGTTMQFNKGAYFNYHNSYFVNNGMNYGGQKVKYEIAPVPTPQATTAPTPRPDYTGQLCYPLYENWKCPLGYVCNNQGAYHNPSQAGQCERDPDQSQYLDLWGMQQQQQANSPTPWAMKSVEDYLPKGNGWFSERAATCANACGFKALNGECWCDSQCKENGDCCEDIRVCTSAFVSVSPTPAYRAPSSPTPAPCKNPKLAGDCSGKCGTLGAVYVGGAKCFCDKTCRIYGDCCCSFETMCS